MKNIYLDHVATNPLHPEAFEAMLPYLKENFGNPLSVYKLGVNAKEAIEEARKSVASLINAKPSEIIFTASGAESNNLAIKGVAHAKHREGNHIIVSKMEHHSILNTVRTLEREGFFVTYLSPDKYGVVDPQLVENAIKKETILISVIHANSEVGTIEPIEDIGAIARKKGIVFHVDAVATVGNIAVDVDALKTDLLSLAAHQFYGPKGAAALYVRQGTRLVPLIYGGVQENGRRAGTENVPAIVGMGKAAEIAKRDLDKRINHLKRLRDKLIKGILTIDKITLTGHPENRLPGHASFVVEHIEGEGMLLFLNAQGVSAASGSACTSKALKASPVLSAMGIEAHLAHGSIVFTAGESVTEDDIDYTVDVFRKTIERLRAMSPFA
jgi:cysteine desulfurase